MKVLIISTMYPNSIMYLSGVFVHKQVIALQKSGVEVIVFAPIPAAPYPLKLLKKKWKLYDRIPMKEIIDGVEVYHPRYFAIPGGILKDFWGIYLARSILNVINNSEELRNVDLIHAHGSLPDDHVAQILSGKLNKPYIITVHGETVNYLIKKRYFYRSKEAIINANAIIGISNKVVRKIEQYTGRKINVFRIWNGYSPVKPATTKNSDHLTILFGGNMVKSKGCEYLLKAYSELIKEFDNIHLVLAGGGKLLSKMKKLASDLKISDRLTFKGTVDNKTMLSLMAFSDIFILPSVNEGFGIVYLEAMSLRVPVIGTEGEGIADIIQDGVNGLLVKPGSVESIVQKLRLLINSAELRGTLGNNGYESIKNLTWENNARETIKVYESVLHSDVK